ncbi:glycosyltransferase [Fibrella sp. ES10-3-2-2]|nr:hypothetical protein A6C57_05890 [Fibrella sp. ES10-3-2-2]
MIKRLIVISGINMTDSGKLSILNDCINYLSEHFSTEWRIIALVPQLGLLSAPNIEYIQFPLSKKRWIYRLYYEYIYFYFLSRRLKPYLWLSLHDISPNVDATVRAVYCHNATVFYRTPIKFFLFDSTLTLFSLFYKYLYKLNIKKNNFVIVQQNWFKTSFENLFNLRNVVVAYPLNKSLPTEQPIEVVRANTKNITFFYPTVPRIFKNIEVIAEATKILNEKGYSNFEVILTFGENDNKYTKYLQNKYGSISNLKHIGFISRADVFDHYKSSHFLLFPSLLESWGLPISEAKQFGLPMIVADMPYARESIGSYDKAKLFDPTDSFQLADIMEDGINHRIVYDTLIYKEGEARKDWEQLFTLLLG